MRLRPKVFFALPYYTGSHKYWADNILKFGTFDYHLETMSGRHWKWRMQGSAIHLAEKYTSLNYKGHNHMDIVLCSTMMDVSLFKSISNCQVPIVYYMHENQLTYPFSESDTRKKEDFHYGFINFKSCLASDLILFNSEFHRADFFDSLSKLLQRLPDYINPASIVKQLFHKSQVNYVGVDFGAIEQILDKQPNNQRLITPTAPTLLWNHRWEHDKNPALFKDLIDYIDAQNQDFHLILLGEDGNASSIKEDLIDKYKEKVLYAGYVKQKADYYDLIKKADLLPVTSNQDFYGLSVLEAIYLGVTPLLPQNRVYSEFLSESFYSAYYYSNGNHFLAQAMELIINPSSDLNTSFLKNHLSYKTTARLESELSGLYLKK